jgi:biopolymer transport protein ExbB
MNKSLKYGLLVGGVALTVAFPALAEGAAGAANANKFGLKAALFPEGEPANWVGIATVVIMAIMSVGSWFIMITKYLEQNKVINQSQELDKKFWTAGSISEGAGKLDKQSAFRQVVDDGLRAAAHHDGRLTDKIDQHEWITMSLQRSVGAIQGKLQGGLAFLATVGSTSPFIGLFGTVVGIYRALIKIAIEGQASIDKVAGPVGEALIMTAIGLFVAVPAVMGYNWLVRRNKIVMDKVNHFASDTHAFLVSGARIAAPVMGTTTQAKK